MQRNGRGRRRTNEIRFWPHRRQNLHKHQNKCNAHGKRRGRRWENGLYLLPVYTIAGNVIGRNEKNGGHQLGVNQDIAPTLTGADRHAVAYAARVSPKAGAKAGGIGHTEEASPTLMSQHRPAVVYGYTQSWLGRV